MPLWQWSQIQTLLWRELSYFSLESSTRKAPAEAGASIEEVGPAWVRGGTQREAILLVQIAEHAGRKYHR